MYSEKFQNYFDLKIYNSLHKPALEKLFLEKETTGDFEIKCVDGKLKCHKLILSAGLSTYFFNLLSGRFAFKDQHTHFIDESYGILYMQRIVEFLYKQLTFQLKLLSRLLKFSRKSWLKIA